MVAIALMGCDRLLGLTAVKPIDAAAIDAPSAPPHLTQAFAWQLDNNKPQLALLDYPVGLALPASLVVVTVGLGNRTPGPTIDSVTYGGAQLNMLVAIAGIPAANDDTSTLTEQWWLAAPQLESGDLMVVLGSVGSSTHLSAMFFAGVNQQQPFHDKQTITGDDTSSMITVATNPDEIVESVTGQGNSIIGPGSGSTSAFEDNGTNGDSLDNAWGSITPSAGSNTTVQWLYDPGIADGFQTVAASLRP
ncbi:MAG TPA: hypothetical protein VMJ10_23685 [Kofleriaceae bacterium]|nr:hypothetical protein [Kofleriaceae bacterium]